MERFADHLATRKPWLCRQPDVSAARAHPFCLKQLAVFLGLCDARFQRPAGSARSVEEAANLLACPFSTRLQR